MEKDRNKKVGYKENNAHCVEKLKANWDTKSFSYSTTRWSTCLDPSGIISKKLFHITSSGPSDNPSVSPPFAIIVHTSHLPIIAPTTLPSYSQSKKPMMLVL